MSPRPFKRDGGEGFRPWKRGEGRNDNGFRRNFGQRPEGEVDAEGNFRSDSVWRSRDAQRGGFDRRPPWRRDRDDRDGDYSRPMDRRVPWRRDRDGDGEDDRGQQGGFDRRPPWRRDRDEGGDRGFDRRPPWRRDHDEGRFGDHDRGFDRRPPWRRDRDEGGERGFDRRPPWKRDRDGGRFGDRGFDRRPPWKRDRDEGGDRGFDRRPPWKRDRDEDDTGREDQDAPEALDEEELAGEAAFAADDGASEDAVDESADEASQTFEDAPRAEKPRAKRHEIPDGELIYGRQPVREMFRSGRRIVHKLILADGVKASEEVTEIEALANERGVPVERHERETLDGWLNNANHQGVLAVCADYPYADFDEIVDAFLKKEGNALLVLLDHVVDPQNLGSLMRTCEAAGVCGVVLPADRAVGVTPASVRASAGAAEHLSIARVSSLPDAILKLKEAKDEAGEPVFVNVVGLEGADDSEPYTDIDYKGKTAIVVGSEGLGLGKLVKERCDHLAKLPMFGKVSSLNAGVAGALAIYEALRQFR